jgi:ribonuclease Y
VQTIVTVATLILLLLALLTVMLARRDAAQERIAARRDTETIREEARSLMSEAQRREERVAQREKESLADQRNAQAYVRTLEERVAVVAKDEKRLVARRDELRSEYEEKLAALANLSPTQAREELRRHLKDSVAADVARETRSVLRRAKEDADLKARAILVDAMQRQTGEAALQAAITRIDLPSEEMKGRVIGREGRNIRAFEALTGVNVIVEEGVNAVQLSSFDVARREIAAVTLQRLVEDGRIQPQRIEAAYRVAADEAPQRARDAALDAADAAGVEAIPQTILTVLGELRLRSSYGQNVLDHLVETARIASEIAASVGADVEITRRAAFLHDIGKAFTVEQSGSHAALGAAFARDQGEGPVVVNAIAAHHDEVDHESLEAVIVQIADALSASRPGARREDAEGYIERMEALEAMVAERPEVAQVFAMAAGRELRVVVKPEKVSDAAVAELARTIAEHIEKDFTFAGEIRVTVIRETRADSVAGQA